MPRDGRRKNDARDVRIELVLPNNVFVGAVRHLFGVVFLVKPVRVYDVALGALALVCTLTLSTGGPDFLDAVCAAGRKGLVVGGRQTSGHGGGRDANLRLALSLARCAFGRRKRRKKARYPKTERSLLAARAAMAKRSRSEEEEKGLVFDLGNCIGGNDEDSGLLLPRLTPVVTSVAFAHGSGATDNPQTAFVPIVAEVAPVRPFGIVCEDVDGEPLIENLGVTYSPVTDKECRTPDPVDMLDSDSMAVLQMLCGEGGGGGGGCDDRLQPPVPLRANVVAPVLNQSGQHGCFATHPVSNPPLLAPARPTAVELAAGRAVPEHKHKSDKPPVLNMFNSIKENHVGVLSEFGGVHAWMRRQS